MNGDSTYTLSGSIFGARKLIEIRFRMCGPPLFQIWPSREIWRFCGPIFGTTRRFQNGTVKMFFFVLSKLYMRFRGPIFGIVFRGSYFCGPLFSHILRIKKSSFVVILFYFNFIALVSRSFPKYFILISMSRDIGVRNILEACL